MKTTLAAFFALLLGMQILFPQTDFRISEDNIPSTFIQKDPRLFPGNGKGFILAWDDPRDGEGFYAQLFDTGGFPVDDNFPVTSNMDIVYAGDGSWLVLHEEYYMIYDEGGFNHCISDIYGTIYTSDRGAGEPVLLNSGGIYLCLIRSLAFDENIHYFNGSFLFTRLFMGYLMLYRFDNALEEIFEYDFTENLLIGAYAMTSAVIEDKGYAVGWVNEDDIVQPYGVYGSFFNTENEVLADSVLLFHVHDFGHQFLYEIPMLRSIVLQDSIYQMFYIHPDSLQLRYRSADIHGNMLTEVGTLSLLDSAIIPSGHTYDIIEFQLLPGEEDGFAAVITVDVIGMEQRDAIIYFNGEGEPTGEMYARVSTHHRFDAGVFHTGYSHFYVPGVYEDDIWLYTFINFDVQDSIKVNDDDKGGNQTSPRIAIDKEGDFFVSWHDEKFIRGKPVTPQGIIGGDQIELEGRHVLILSDGTSIQRWSKEIDEKQWAVGVSWYDDSWTIIQRDTLAIDNTKDNIELQIAVPNDSTVFIFYRQSDQAYIRSMDHNASLINETTVDGYTGGSGLKIFPRDEHSIWFGWSNRMVRYSTDLQQLSDILTFSAGIAEYLGEDRFIGVMYAYSLVTGDREAIGILYDGEGTILEDEIDLAMNPTELTVRSLGNDYFIALFSYDGRIYAGVYDTAGKEITDPFVVHHNMENRNKNPAVAVYDDNVLFTWADSRMPGNGYDIYGRIYSLEDITTSVEPIDITIPEEYTLSQNYPNPFNPSTTIEYSLPHSGKVKLSVYDILGRQIAVLVDEYQNAGTYRVVFDASGLSSGIYIYRLREDSHSEVKLMMLIR